MSEMVERVAHAIMGPVSLPEAMRLARLAIAAMREPTEAMVRAGKTDSYYFVADAAAAEPDLVGIYRSMIDKALEE